MRIGLYSELGRRNIVQIQEEIKQSNVNISSHNAMRSFRNKIINSEEEHHKRITRFADFYNMGMLRDWLFHEYACPDVQEHLFTIPQIEASLSSLGLVFCGFENGDIVQNFKSSPTTHKVDMCNDLFTRVVVTHINFLSGDVDNTLYDLEKWDTYEKEHPLGFAGWYKFWCQKGREIND